MGEPGGGPGGLMPQQTTLSSSWIAQLKKAAEDYLEAYPDATRAADVKALMKKGARRASIVAHPVLPARSVTAPG